MNSTHPAKRLQVSTPSDTAIVMTRTFDAPRAHVWRSMTEPALLRRWLFGPDGWSMTACESELRVGSGFRYAWRHADGQEMAVRGVYREIVAPEKLVRTECFEFGCTPQAGEQVVTMLLAEQNGRTTLTLNMRFPDQASRDGMLASGMERGVSAGYERIDAILAELA